MDTTASGTPNHPGLDGTTGPIPPAERPEDHLAALRPVGVPAGAVRAALLLLDEIQAQPGQSRRMRGNAREVRDVLAPALRSSASVGEAVSLAVPAPTGGGGEWVQWNTYLPAGLRRRLKAVCAIDGIEIKHAATEALEAWLAARERAM
ncbi:hypothetical protein ACWC5I_19870 [Kitasatospora sp. NPDC001574]